MIKKATKKFKPDIIHLFLILISIISIALNLNFYVKSKVLQGDIQDLYDSSSTAEEKLSKAIMDKGQEIFIVNAGDTLSKILNTSGISPADNGAIINSLNGVFDPSQLRIAQKVEVNFYDQDSLINLGIQPEQYYSKAKNVNIISDEVKVEISFDTNEKKYIAKSIITPLKIQRIMISGTIKESLYSDAIKQGASPSAIIEMINKFSYDVDFQRDIKFGDRYIMLYTSFVNDEGKKVRDGNLIYSSMILSGKNIEIFRYEEGKGAEYFDRNGNSIKKALLKTPINGAKISSAFGKRKHPILGYSRMHKGLDYRAPSGTPILAAGDGIIEFASYSKNGYGKHIKIKHTQKYSTLYAHLDRFAKGIKKGIRVMQGDVVGYVGTTGLSTGPHLHYEVHENGIQVNPSILSIVKSPGLSGQSLEIFKQNLAEIDLEIKNYNNNQL